MMSSGSNDLDSSGACKYCGEYVIDDNVEDINALRNHLTECPEFPHRHRAKKQKTVIPDMIENYESDTEFDQVPCREKLARLFIETGLPFSYLENDAFRRYTEVLQPKFSLPSRFELMSDCLALFKEERNKLKQYFYKYSPRVCLTVEIWSSSRNLNYLCLACHFVDEEWKLQKKIINFCQIPNNSAKVIGMTIERCLVSWDISKVLTIVIDNGSLNDDGFQYLKRRFQSWNTLIMKGQFLHMQCCAQILSSTVKEVLKEFDGSICKVRSVVRYVRSSPSNLARFKSCVEQEKIESESLVCLDDEGQWNSTYLMLEAAVKFERAFQLLEMQDWKFREEFQKGKMNGIPLEEDWECVRNILPFLELYHDVWRGISGSPYITCNQFEDILGITCAINDECESSNTSLSMIAKRIKRSHDKYWSNINSINMLFVATVLDPRNKLQFVEWAANEIYDPLTASQLLDRISSTLHSLFDYYDSIRRSILKQPSADSQSGSGASSQMKSRNIPRIRALFLQKMKGEDLIEKSELDKYLGEACEPYMEKLDILDWWKKSSCRYPTLALMAKEILAIPLSTMTLESTFNIGDRVLDDFHSSLTPMMVEAMICAQDWLKTSSSPMSVEENFEELEKLESKMSLVMIHPAMLIQDD